MYGSGSVFLRADRIQPARAGSPGDGLCLGARVPGGVPLPGGRKPDGRCHAAVSGGDCHALLSGDFFPWYSAHHLPGCSAVSAHPCADGGDEAGGHIFFSLAVFIKLAVLAGRVSAQRGSGGGQGMKRVAMWFLPHAKRYMRKWSSSFHPPAPSCRGAGSRPGPRKGKPGDISISHRVWKRAGRTPG